MTSRLMSSTLIALSNFWGPLWSADDGNEFDFVDIDGLDGAAFLLFIELARAEPDVLVFGGNPAVAGRADVIPVVVVVGDGLVGENVMTDVLAFAGVVDAGPECQAVGAGFFNADAVGLLGGEEGQVGVMLTRKVPLLMVLQKGEQVIEFPGYERRVQPGWHLSGQSRVTRGSPTTSS